MREVAELPANSVLMAPISSYGPDWHFASVDCRYAGDLHNLTLWVMDPRSTTNSLLRTECITDMSIYPSIPELPSDPRKEAPEPANSQAPADDR